VIDEIGKMELFSKHFRKLILDVLNSGKQVLASIPLKGNEFIQQIKQRSDIYLLEVTNDNRNLLVDTILE
jgi:nucleoside-triphosphatase THEP1